MDRRSTSTTDDTRMWLPTKTAGYLSRSSVSSSKSMSSPFEHISEDRVLLSRLNSLLVASDLPTAETLESVPLALLSQLYVSFPARTFSRQQMLGSLDHTTIKFDVRVRQTKLLIGSMAQDVDGVMTPLLRDRLENLSPREISLEESAAFREFLEMVVVVGERIWERMEAPRPPEGRRISAEPSTPRTQRRRGSGGTSLGGLVSPTSRSRRSVSDGFGTPRAQYRSSSGSIMSWVASPTERKRQSSAELLASFKGGGDFLTECSGDSENERFSAVESSFYQLGGEEFGNSSDEEEINSASSSTVKQGSVGDQRDTVGGGHTELELGNRENKEAMSNRDNTTWTDSPISSSCSDIEHISSSFMDELIVRCEALLAGKTSAASRSRSCTSTALSGEPSQEKKCNWKGSSETKLGAAATGVEIPAVRPKKTSVSGSDRTIQGSKAEPLRTTRRKHGPEGQPINQNLAISKRPSTLNDLLNKNIPAPAPQSESISMKSNRSNKAANADIYWKHTVTKVVSCKQRRSRNGLKSQQPRNVKSKKSPGSPQSGPRGKELSSKGLQNQGMLGKKNDPKSEISDWETVVSSTFEIPPPTLRGTNGHKSNTQTPRNSPKGLQLPKRDRASHPATFPTKIQPTHPQPTPNSPGNHNDADDRTSLYSVSSVSWGTDLFTAAARQKRQTAVQRLRELQERFDKEIEAKTQNSHQYRDLHISNRSEENKFRLRPQVQMTFGGRRGGDSYGLGDTEQEEMDTDTGLTEVEEELMSLQEQGRREAVRQTDLLRALIKARGDGRALL